MSVILPTDEDGKLVPYTEEEVADMDIRRRGVRTDNSHVTYQLGPEGSGCTRKFSCDWNQRFRAAIRFAGAVSAYVDGGGDTKISRLIPQRDPDFPNWICTRVEIMPWCFTGEIEEEEEEEEWQDGPERLPVFKRAELVVKYEQSPMDFLDDDDTTSELERYLIRPGYPTAPISTNADYIGLPGGILNFATLTGAGVPAGIPIPYPVGFVEPKSALKFILERWPEEAWGPSSTYTQRIIGTASARGYLGAVNKTTFQGYPPLQLQLMGVEPQFVPDPTGLGYCLRLGLLMSDKPVPYGHLGLYHHATTGGGEGYYMALRRGAGTTTLDPASIGDNDALFHVREFADLAVIGDLV